MTSQTTTWTRRLVPRIGLVWALVAVTSPSHAAPSQHQALRVSAPLSAATSELVTPAANARVEDASAAELGLGTRAVASQLLVRAPVRALRELAPGEGSARLLWPIEGGAFVRGFGFVRSQRKELPHLGVDIAAKTGTPIHVAADGLVAYADDGVKGYGNLAIVVHADGAVTSYAHCSKLLATPGQRVRAGDVIAEVGSTGISRGPHLHFEYRLRGKPANPMRRFQRPMPPHPPEPEVIAALAR